MGYKIDLRKVAIAMSFGLAVGAPTLAYSDIITMQMDGIPGETAFAQKYDLPLDSIRVLTVGNSVKSAIDCSSGSCLNVITVGNLTAVKNFGESSGPLFLLAVTGKAIKIATISFYRAQDGLLTKYYTITVRNLYIASQKWVGNASGDKADAESLELAFAQIELLDNETGSKTCFDVKRKATC